MPDGLEDYLQNIPDEELAEQQEYEAQLAMEQEAIENDLKRDLKPLNAVIQICKCGHVDAYKGDDHTCGQSALNSFNFNEDYKW